MIHINPEAFVRTSTSRPPDWNLLRVSPHMERRVCEALEKPLHAFGASVYVPIETYRPQRATKNRTRPLIPGYIFANLPNDEALDLARANHAVKQLMCTGGRPLRVRAIDIGSMILFEATGGFDLTWNQPWAKKRNTKRGRRPLRNWEHGQLVKVKEGPFAGFCGDIVRADRNDRIRVAVMVFGRVSDVELDEDAIECAA